MIVAVPDDIVVVIVVVVMVIVVVVVVVVIVVVVVHLMEFLLTYLQLMTKQIYPEVLFLLGGGSFQFLSG